MPRSRMTLIVVFAFGTACGIGVTQGFFAPELAVAQVRTRSPAIRQASTSDLSARVAALESKLQRLEQSVVVANTGAVTINGPLLRINSSAFEVQAPVAKFGGIIDGKTLSVKNVIASSYTPGAGNIW